MLIGNSLTHRHQLQKMTSTLGSRDEKNRRTGLDLCCQRKHEEMECQTEKRRTNSRPKGPQEVPSPRMSIFLSGAFRRHHNGIVRQTAGLARSSCWLELQVSLTLPYTPRDSILACRREGKGLGRHRSSCFGTKLLYSIARAYGRIF